MIEHIVVSTAAVWMLCLHCMIQATMEPASKLNHILLLFFIRKKRLRKLAALLPGSACAILVHLGPSVRYSFIMMLSSTSRWIRWRTCFESSLALISQGIVKVVVSIATASATAVGNLAPNVALLRHDGAHAGPTLHLTRPRAHQVQGACVDALPAEEHRGSSA